MKRTVVAFCLGSILIGGCSYVNRQLGLNDDNLAEELLEAAIEKETGLDIDLTPDTQE